MSLSRRKFTKEFKETAVRRLELGASIAEVARAREVNMLRVVRRFRADSLQEEVLNRLHSFRPAHLVLVQPLRELKTDLVSRLRRAQDVRRVLLRLVPVCNRIARKLRSRV